VRRHERPRWDEIRLERREEDEDWLELPRGGMSQE